MKKDTMKKLLKLPKDRQDKVWGLAMDRLKLESKRKNEARRLQDEQMKK